MDRKSITGLLIIAGILIIFSLFNRPEADENAAGGDSDTTKREEVDRDIAEDTDSTLSDTLALDSIVIESENLGTLTAKLDEEGNPIFDSTGKQLFTANGIDTAIATMSAGEEKAEKTDKPSKCDEELITLENDKLIVQISNQGGRINSVWLKEFKTYDAYVNEKDEPLQLFDDKTNYGIEFYSGEKKKNSKDYCFKIVESTKTTAKVEMITKGKKKVGFTYALNEGKYDVDFGIYFKGFSDKDASDLAMTTDISMLSTEKHLESERRIATLFFKYREDSYDYLSIAGADELELEQKTDWIAYKQSYFSAIIMNDQGFPASDGGMVEVMETGDDSTYVKRYKSKLNLGVTNVDNTIDLSWYFGPNDYDELATYENGVHDIVDLGWGLFRWINVYAIRPLFNFLLGLGMGTGLAILLLTIIVKILLSPVNYKMYKSSAMMKVLKPEIEKITKKFPKKEDAMKKQQETMALYRETGVSPMAGCVPMLIQMPILFAIFRLFPSSIELRQTGFLWAEDLSTYDSVLDLGFNIPFYGDHISLFTLLMAGTTLAYTHYNSQNMTQPTAEGMPNMKIIMYIFPFLMIFFFNSYSSGLSYYYFISTLMTMGIMFSIKRFFIDEEKIHAQIEANRKDPNKKKKKSKFAQRLEEAQKQAQERQKNRKR